jgi:hypothetical protein
MRLMKTATLAAALVGVIMGMPYAFSESVQDNNGRGDSLPQGIQNNKGLAEHGKGDTQGQHTGWTKENKEEKADAKSEDKSSKGEQSVKINNAPTKP